MAVNPLLSTQKSSDGLHVSLHPLPILEISDYITRSFQRGYKGALVGALLGEPKGREITIEHSFTCGVKIGEDGTYALDTVQFSQRLEQMKLVHKSPQLELVGWYTLIPMSGPTKECLPIHTEILDGYNESAVLLGFHLEQILDPAPGNPLPLTIYESNLEAEDSSKDAQVEGEDREMKDSDSPPKMALRFRELPYTTETGEAEMIAMQFIREGVANARLDGSQQLTNKKHTASKGKGKGKAETLVEGSVSEGANLTKEELEQIAGLQTKANALKMMRDRIALLVAYLDKLPDGYKGSAATAIGQPRSNETVQPSLNILRQIQALATNLELVTPAQQDILKKELLSETNDVKIIGLVTDVLSGLGEIRNAGKKFSVMESARRQRTRQSQKDDSLGDTLGLSAGSLSAVGDLML